MYRQIDSERVVLDKLRDEVAALGSQRAWARRAGVSPQYVCDVLKGRASIGDMIAVALGYRRAILFERLPKADPVSEAPLVIERHSVSYRLIEALLEQAEYEVLP